MNSFIQKGLLMVGAGGIGSEVANILVQTYTGRLAIVDMDVIQLSNLNRQAFFAEHHINRYKAEILAESIRALTNGQISPIYFTNSITDACFTIDFFLGFSCILSCVDNVEAREHINTMAVIANVPVIESGSSGYHGQVQITLPRVTECYACTESLPPKSFPICTLREIPILWHHCVHWAMYDLLPRIQEAISENASAHNEADEIIKTVISSYHLTVSCKTLEKIVSAFSCLGESFSNFAESPDSTSLVHALAAIKAVKYKIQVPAVDETLEILKKTIPSVITTNAIIAGVILLQLKLLRLNKPKNIYYISSNPPITRVVGTAPNPFCLLCSSKPHILRVKNDEKLLSLLNAANIKIENTSVILKNNSLLYDDEYKDLLYIQIKELKIKTGTLLKVTEKEVRHILYIIIIEQ